MTDLQRLVIAAKAMPEIFGELNDCVYCHVIFKSRYGVSYDSKHKKNCRWLELQRAAKKASKP